MASDANFLTGKPSHKILSAFKNKISFIYFEYGNLVRESNSLLFRQGKYEFDIPAATLTFILLGPGTTITQPAIAELSRWGCSVSFVNGGSLGVHSSYIATSATTAKFSILQAEIVSDKDKRLTYARKMYSHRWGEKSVPKTYNINKLMMLEGRRMKTLYANEAEKYNIPNFVRSSKPDPSSSFYNINSLLTISNHLLYGLVNAAVLNLGFSPRLGIIHHGHANSFTFDIADLYKESYIIPLCFELGSAGLSASELRQEFRKRAFDYSFIPQIVEDMLSLMDITSEDIDSENAEEKSYLWAGSEIIDNEGYSIA